MDITKSNSPMIKSDNAIGGSRTAGGIINYLFSMLELMKIPLSLHITLTGVVGYLLFNTGVTSDLIWVSVSIFLLSTGSASLNNFQDRHLDASCLRTRNRALPSGRLFPSSALIQGYLLVTLGAITLFLYFTSVLPLLLGLTAVVFYNLVYTNLKYKTSLAIVPGAICGMLPPYIGWLAAGGDLYSREILLLMAIMGVWQIPHYWIILLNHQRDYRQKQVIPTILNRFEKLRLYRTAFVWISGFAFLSTLPVLYGIISSRLSTLLLFSNALILIAFSIVFLSGKKQTFPRFLHIHFSVALTITLSIIVFEKII